MNRQKNLWLTIVLLLILTSFNYGSMFYQRLIGNGGTWVEYYHYKTSSDNLLADIIDLKQRNKQLCPPNDTNLFIDQKEYTYIKFYDKNKYYHTWVSNDTTAENSLLIFGGLSTTPNYKDAELINRDMSFLTRRITLSRFKEIILCKLDIAKSD